MEENEADEHENYEKNKKENDFVKQNEFVRLNVLYYSETTYVSFVPRLPIFQNSIRQTIVRKKPLKNAFSERGLANEGPQCFSIVIRTN